MSWQRVLIDQALRRVEKPYLAHETRIPVLRSGFERRARVFFRPPRGTMLAEDTCGGVPVVRHVSETPRAPLLYFHGGAYILGSPRTHAALAVTLADAAGLSAWLPRYRLAPEHPFPAAIEDAIALWRALPDPHCTVLAGDSAGAGLALALIGEILRLGLPPPRGCVAFSALTDLTFSGRSFVENRALDAMLPARRSADVAGMVAAAADRGDPRLSPLFADFRRAPHIWMAVGDGEILRDDTLRLAQRLPRVTVELGRGLPHVWPIFHSYLPEARATLGRAARWITHLPASES